MTPNSNKYNTPLLIAGVLFIIWGILGIMDSKNYTYDGFSTDGNNTITEVDDGSPASAAGMQVGDVLKSSGGISVQDNKALSNRERAKIGDTREFVVDRKGEEVTLQISYAAMTGKGRSLNLAAFIIGLLFILLGLYAHSRKKTALSLFFALFTLGFGFSFFGGPYIGPGFLSKVVGAVGLTFILLSFAALANFTLKYPPESAILSKKNGPTWLYVPAAILIVFFWFMILVQPDGTSTMNTVMRALVGLFVVFYFGLAVITLIRKFAKASSEERKASGLNLMLTGAVLGLLPMLIYFTIQSINPKVILPGSDYIFLTFGLIPIFFTLALLQQGKAQEAT